MAKLVKKMGCGGIDQTPPTHIVQNNISSDTLRFLTSFFLGDFQGCSKVILGDVIHQSEKIIKNIVITNIIALGKSMDLSNC